MPTFRHLRRCQNVEADWKSPGCLRFGMFAQKSKSTEDQLLRTRPGGDSVQSLSLTSHLQHVESAAAAIQIRRFALPRATSSALSLCEAPMIGQGFPTSPRCRAYPRRFSSLGRPRQTRLCGEPFTSHGLSAFGGVLIKCRYWLELCLQLLVCNLSYCILPIISAFSYSNSQ